MKQKLNRKLSQILTINTSSPPYWRYIWHLYWRTYFWSKPLFALGSLEDIMASVSIASTVGAAANFKNLLMLNCSRATARVHSSMRHFNHRIHPPVFVLEAWSVSPHAGWSSSLRLLACWWRKRLRDVRASCPRGIQLWTCRLRYQRRTRVPGVHACVTGRSYRRYLNESL